MKRRTPISSRKWREITDFDLKVLSIVIIALSLSTITLALYTFYLKLQKSQVDVVVREITPQESKAVEKITKTATQTTIILESTPETLTMLNSTNTLNTSSERALAVDENGLKTDQKSINNETQIRILSQSDKNQAGQEQETTSTRVSVQVTQQATQNASITSTISTTQSENKYLKDLTKFDYNILVSRMAENLPARALNEVYVYVVDSENALRLAKSTQNYVIDQAGSGKYLVLTIDNILPDLKPVNRVYTVITEPTRDSKEAFKSVVNFRTFGISAFTISTSNGYVVCMGLFTSESVAKNFYYSQDWMELSKYGYVKGAKVTKIGG
ncbi:MAG: hypothetical protein ACP5KD_01340 [Fervidobacterium sp.]